jgi:hypothetical protein
VALPPLLLHLTHTHTHTKLSCLLLTHGVQHRVQYSA